MIKIIKYGNKNRVKCGYCEALLEYEKEDIRTVMTGMNELQKEITCPLCGETVVVKRL